MVDAQLIRSMLHDMANKLMTAAGTVSLMRLDKLPVCDEQLEDVETSLDALGEILTHAREVVKQSAHDAPHNISQCVLCTIPTAFSSKVLDSLNNLRKNAKCHGIMLFDTCHLLVWVNGDNALIGSCYGELVSLLGGIPVTLVDVTDTAPTSGFDTMQLVDADNHDNREHVETFWTWYRGIDIANEHHQHELSRRCADLIRLLH